jgi:hypothetical protein
MRIDCDVTVLDSINGLVLYRKTIRGSEPEMPEPSGETVVGSRPYDAIIAYLRRLGSRRN